MHKMKAYQLIAFAVSLCTPGWPAHAGQAKIAEVRGGHLLVSAGQPPTFIVGLGAVTTVAAKQSASPKWSPDGKLLAYLNKKRLQDVALTELVINDDKGNVKSRIDLSVVGRRDDLSDALEPSLSWAGGERVVVAYAFKGSQLRYAINVNTNSGRIVDSSFEDGPIASYSPDGRHVAYASAEPRHFAEAGSVVYSLAIDGVTVWSSSDVERLRFRTEPMWSTDGASLAMLLSEDDDSQGTAPDSLLLWKVSDANRASVTHTAISGTLIEYNNSFGVRSVTGIEWIITNPEAGNNSYTLSKNNSGKIGPTKSELMLRYGVGGISDSDLWCSDCIKEADEFSG